MNRFLGPGEFASIILAGVREEIDALPPEKRARAWWLFPMAFGADPGPWEDFKRFYDDKHGVMSDDEV